MRSGLAARSAWEIAIGRLCPGAVDWERAVPGSTGFAWSIGRPDNGITLEQALAHFEEIAASVDLPVNGDFEGGFAIEPDEVAANVRRASGTGIAGVSIEDSTGAPADPLFEF